MTKISQLSSIGDSLAIDDQFLIRDVSDAVTPNKSVTVSGITRALDLGTAAAPAIAFASDKNTGIYSPGADQVAISTNGSGRLYINSSGDVGVGVASPAATFGGGGGAVDANGPIISRGALNAELNSCGVLQYNSNVTTLRAYGSSAFSGVLAFATGGGGNPAGTGTTEYMRLTADGKLGLGTSSPSSALDVIGSVEAANSLYNPTTGSNWSTTPAFIAQGVFGGGISIVDGSNGFTAFADSSGSRFNFAHAAVGSTPAVGLVYTNTGRVGIGTTSPAATLHSRSDNAGSGSTPLLIQNRSISANTAVGISFAPNTSDTADRSAIIYGVNESGGSGNATGLTFHTNANGGSPQEKARIDSSGRLLVGTSSSPSAGNWAQYALIKTQGKIGESFGPGIINLARGEAATSIIADENIGGIAFSDQTGNEFALITCAADAAAGSGDYPGRLVFSTTADGASSPTERMRIDSAGALKTSTNGTYKFGTGTQELTHNDTTSTIHLAASNTSFTGDAVTISTYRNTTNDTYKFLACIRQGFVIALEIRDDGDVYNVNGTYGSLSDIKLKENIVDAQSQWDDIKQLRVRNYNFKPETNNSTHKQIGVIAQELETVSPGLVNTVSDRDKDGNDLGTTTKSVNYSVLYMKAVKALQEAMERIENLEAKVAALEGV